MKYLIIGAGEAPSLKLFKNEARFADSIIAADGGGNFLFQHSIIPNFLIGDFDSIDNAALNCFITHKVELFKYSQDKKVTDLKLALNKAKENGAQEIIFLGCLSKDIDHVFGNIHILLDCVKANIEAQIKDDEKQLKIINKPSTIIGRAGERFSLLAYGATVESLSIKGSKYELSNYNLQFGELLTLSNEFLSKKVQIDFQKIN